MKLLVIALLVIGFAVLYCVYDCKKGQLKMTDEEITEVDFSCSNFLYDNCVNKEV